MLVIDEYPVRRLLLAKHDNLNLTGIERLRPDRQRRGQGHLDYLDIALPHKEIDGWGIV